MNDSKPVSTSWGRAVFDRIYSGSADPWNFNSSDYERAKYAATLGALPRSRFAACLEVGCSIGILTRSLAGRCDTLLGIDISEVALSQARLNCAGLDQVRLARAQVPHDWPDDTFDLIVLSEVLYFLDNADLDRLSSRVLTSLRADGVVLLVNWTGETDTPNTGDHAATRLMMSVAPYLSPTLQLQNTTYRIDRLHWNEAFRSDNIVQTSSIS